MIGAVFVRDASKLCQFVTDMAESQMLNIRKLIDLKLDICNLRAGKKNSATIRNVVFSTTTSNIFIDKSNQAI